MGTPVQTTGGLTITALKWQQVTSNNQFNTPPPGGYFAASDVKMCAGTTAITVGPSNWTVINSDESQITGEYDASLVNLPRPELKSTSLNPGQCVSGWVEFIVTQGVTPTEIQPTGANYYWTIA